MYVPPFGPEAKVLASILSGLAGVIITAVTLRAACCLFNKIARGKYGQETVREPSFYKAMVIAFILLLTGEGIGSMVAPAVDRTATWWPFALELIFLPIQYLVAVAVVRAFLLTTYRRAALVVVIQFAVAMAITAPAAAIIAVVFFVIR